MRSGLIGAVLGLSVVLVACTGEDATPIDQLDQQPTGENPEVTHFLEPNDEMRELAEQQCLDDPDLAVGEINAVDPDDPSQILLSVTVDCAEVR